ncbi:MAG: hypothetical protein KGL40_06320 [Rhodocyclaceae bacterium]|nr:hypothetical protein [Rhodocyclaceae bacterium]
MHDKWIFGLALLLTTSSALADAIVEASPRSRETLDLYTQPNGTESKPVATSDLPMPLPILATQAGFYKVSLSGKEVWLRSMQVRVKRDAAGASCASKAPKGVGVAQETWGATAGAGKNACN